MSDFAMPSLGADMDSGTLLEWLVKPGDSVARGDIVAVVDTDKATVEIEIFESGIVEELVVPEGREVPVGTLLARIRGESEPQSQGAQPPAQAPAQPAPQAPTPEIQPAPTSPDHVARQQSTDRVRATPLARRIAKARGIDLASIAGSGPHGAITREDVESDTQRAEVPVAGAEEPREVPVADAEEQRVAVAPRSGMRAAIAAAMQRSKREIPHYYLETRIELSRALAWLEERNRAHPVTERLLPSVLLHKAIALAARRVPEMNGHWEDDGFVAAPCVHLGTAVSLRDGGLVAPALRNADETPIDELMQSLRDLVNRARKGRLRSSELGTATLTVTSLGDRGVEKVFGVIHPPQVALVGLGRIGEEPWAEHGMLAARPVVTATLSADHRVSDGYRGARFLAEIRGLLEAPETL